MMFRQEGGVPDTNLSIVIPAYNEALRIGRTLDMIGDYLKGCGYSSEIIVVDDGSHDDTEKVVRKMAEKHTAIVLLQNGMNKGKGYSVKRGVLFSRGRFVLMSDADLSTPIEEIGKLFKELEEGYDIAIGSRSVSGSQILKRQAWYRQLMGKIFNKFVQLVAVSGIRDTQCGFKLFKGDAARSVFARQRIEGFAFDVEALYLAKKMGIRIREVPVVWVNSRDSKVSIFRDSLQMLWDILKIRFYHTSPGRGKA
jgi:dolichyl-phosphate beta-glucosyltransferase